MDAVERVPRDAIVRIRRVLERSDLDPVSLGLPPRLGDEAPSDFAEAGEYEPPLLDFGDARGDPFFAGLKEASATVGTPVFVQALLRDSAAGCLATSDGLCVTVPNGTERDTERPATRTYPLRRRRR